MWQYNILIFAKILVNSYFRTIFFPLIAAHLRQMSNAVDDRIYMHNQSEIIFPQMGMPDDIASGKSHYNESISGYIPDVLVK